VGDDRRADAGADQRDDRVPGPLAGAEPQLPLALGLRAVVEVQRQPYPGRAQPLLERHRVPADDLRVHQYPRRRLDGAGQPDADPDDAALHDAREADHLAQAGGHLRDHRGRVGARRAQRVYHGRLAGHREVEQLDLDARFTHVDAHHVAVVRVDPEQYPRPPAVRVDHPGLDDQPVLDQLAGDVADGGHAEPGDLAQFLAAERAVEEELGQQRGPVTPAEVADGGAVGLHRGPICTRGGSLDSSMPHALNIRH
jgi:hypothetical protein